MLLNDMIAWYTANALAGFMDFSVGVLLGALVLKMLRLELKRSLPWYFLACGALALLPDFDIVWGILTHAPLVNHHQFLTHRPIVMLPVGALLGALVPGYYIGRVRGALLGFTCVLWHFIHDTPGFGGTGIAWFWPYSQDYWYLFGHFGQTALPVELEHYFGKTWYEPSVLALRELTIGSVVLVAATVVGTHRTLNWWALCLWTIIGVWISAALLWF